MKDILIHITNLTEHTQAADYGVKLAARFDAAATGVFVYPAPTTYASASDPELVAEIMENARALEHKAMQARQSFLDWAASLDVPQAEWLVAEGAADYALAQASARHDLLILDQASSDGVSAWEVSEIVLRANIPCIVVPRHDPGNELIERVAVGWNGSPEATRALHAALPFMRGRHVLLMAGEIERSDHRVTWKTPFDVAGYLQRHDITVTHRVITASPAEAGDALLEEAMHFDADLLVMGAYGRNRFSEWLLGGATRHALAHTEIPLLLQH